MKKMPAAKTFLNVIILYHLINLRKNFPFTREFIRDRQLKKLKKLLIHAYENFEFYNNLMIQNYFNPYKFKDLSQLSELPAIDKSTYREFSESIFLHNPDKYRLYYKDSTSGSTGMPLKIYRTWNERAYMAAKYLRILFLNQYSIFDKTYSLPSPHRIIHDDSWVQKLGILNRTNVSYTDTIENMVSGYIEANPGIFYANKSQLVQMARYIQQNGIKIKKPKFYVCAAETLDRNSKEIIMITFGNNLIEVYGAVEFNNLAFQILGNDFLYFNHDTNILELEEHGAQREDKGYCIITDLNIYSFPLIRYRLGDYIETDEKDGVCVIKSIKGRWDDWIILRNGLRIPFHPLYEIMDKRSEVLQFRVIQENLDLITIHLVVKENIDKSNFEKILIQELEKEISPSVVYKIEYRPSLEPDSSGKLRMLISKIS